MSEILPCGAARARRNKRVQFSSGLNYLIDIENTVIAMWWLRLHTYDEVAAMIERTDMAALPSRPQPDSCTAANDMAFARPFDHLIGARE
jgi:hypothetical protein